MDKPYETACTLLHHMNCFDIHPVVFCHNTNERFEVKDEQTIKDIESIIKFFNKEYEEIRLRLPFN